MNGIIKNMLKNKLLIFICLVSISVQIFFRYQLTLHRYFDIDEFAHLHWAYSFTHGSMPYRDFFYIFPPYFMFIIGTVISVFGRSAETLIYVRGLMFAVQILSYLVLFITVKKIRNLMTALLAVAVFIYLPLPSDKLLEIRPDLLATLTGLFGLYLFVLAEETRKHYLYFLTGFLFSLSLAIVPKTIFLFVPPVLVIIYDFLKIKKGEASSFWLRFLFFFLGFMINPVVCGIYFAITGKFWLTVYLITALTSNVTGVLASKFYMRPDIFFYPNDTYYGMPGLSLTLLTNLVIYLLGSIWAIGVLISSFSHEDDNRSRREFIFSAAFIINLYAFVKIFPLKHLQYLIPTALFIAFYFADFLMETFSRIRIKGAVSVILSVFIIFITWQSYSIYKYKIPWVNTATLEKVKNILAAISENNPVFDLTGETVFYPDGYYFCCIPYGQYEEALNFEYPELPGELKRRGTKYVHVGTMDRLGVLPNIQAKYIRDNFRETALPGMLEVKQ